MPYDSLKIQSERINAAILVARTLARSQAGKDTAAFARLETRARYAHLLAARSRLDPVETHRLALAAWISGLDRQPDIQAKLAHEHGIDDILAPDNASVQGRLLSLVRFFQQAQTRDARIGRNPPATASLLETQWIQDPNDKTLVRRFLKLLNDERYLDVEQRNSGRVLIVDPEETVTPVLAGPLTAHGCEVSVTANVDSAKHHMTQTLPDTIVARAKLPFVSGIDFCREIKSDSRTARLPFIVLTDRRQRQTERQALQAGADEVFAQPVDLEMFFIKLDRLLTAARDTRIAAEEEAGLDSISGPLENMPFTDTIQILAAGGKNMRILLCQGDEEGEVVVVNGDVVHARQGDLVGPVAFYRFMNWREGSFIIAPCKTPPERNIYEPVMSLLMEGSRLMDEGASP